MVEYNKYFLDSVVMMQKLKFELNLINILFFYIFGILFLQIIEMFLHIKITELVFVAAVALIFLGIVQGKIKIGLDVILVGAVAVVYLLIYYLQFQSIFSYAYPPILIAVLLPLLARNIFLKPTTQLRNVAAYLSLIYLLINVLLYVIHYEACFQVADKIQFKGVLPHSNLFCSIIICIYAFHYNGKGWVYIVNRVLCIAFIFTTSSRTYIVAIALMVIIRWLTAYGKRTSISVKLGILFLVAVVLGPPIILLMLKYVPSMERFVKFGFTGNGRQVLKGAYSYAFESTGLFGKLFGVKTTENYLEYDIEEFPHSFTENSYVGVAVLFGIVGVVYFGYFVLKTCLKSKSFQTIATLGVFLITFFVQDTLLSVQAGLFTVTAVYYLLLQSKQSRIKSPVRSQLNHIQATNEKSSHVS